MGAFSFDEQIENGSLDNVDYIIMLRRLAKEYPNQYVKCGPYTFFVSDLCDALIAKLKEENAV